MPDIPDQLRPLAFLIGVWRGEGEGLWAAEPQFRYGEELTITAPPGKPFLRYEQRTWALDDNRAMHAELGYLRCPSPDAIELLVVQPIGYTEIHTGRVDGTELRLALAELGRAPSAKPVTAVERSLAVRDGALEYLLRLGMNGEPAADHLHAVLRRAEG